MKQDKIIGIVFTAMNLILVIVCIVLYLRTDRRAPEFEFYASEVIYTEDMEQGKLFEGVNAYDSNDGDITDRVVIEKIIEDRENRSAVVYYAVSDKAGNVAKASRVFEAIYIEKEGQESGRFPEAGVDAEMSRLKKTSHTESKKVYAMNCFQASGA